VLGRNTGRVAPRLKRERSEPAGEAEGGAATAALDRAEPAKSESSEIAVALPPEADRLSVDVASAVAVDADVPTQILDETTGSVVVTEDGVPAPVEQGFVPSEPAEAPANSSEPGAGS
jgi:hypothetical protein